ncbi:hypothetical protein, partial [Listeria monocytogenes]|uniref:hypothetical protein n=1 Tax=Listeria monocytogenes TaxID=1639 RepID=UPI0019690E29
MSTYWIGMFVTSPFWQVTWNGGAAASSPFAAALSVGVFAVNPAGTPLSFVNSAVSTPFIFHAFCSSHPTKF